MSALRPTLVSADKKTPIMRDGTAYLLIYKAVQSSTGLIHGRLHKDGDHCAIGSYFDRHDHTGLPSDLIDEVAAVNDSVPNSTDRQRRTHVMKWLRWKLAQVGMPGFAAKK